MTDVKMSVHIGFVHLCAAVTTDDYISSQVGDGSKKTDHIGFVKLCTTVTTDDDISS